MMRILQLFLFCLFCQAFMAQAQPADYVWTAPSHHSSESMPVGGGDIGLNVWVEKGDLLFYVGRSGAFDENNTLLKAGRFRLHFTPDVLADTAHFCQRLCLNEGYMTVTTGGCEVQLWVDVFKPVIHVEVAGRKPLTVDVAYESWRTQDHTILKGAGQQCSYKWRLPKGCVTHRDSIRADAAALTFLHQNEGRTVFDYAVEQQQLGGLRDSLYDPLAHSIFGGRLSGSHWVQGRHDAGSYAGTDFEAWHYHSERPARRHHFQIVMQSLSGSVAEWSAALTQTESQVRPEADRKASRGWWREFWRRSFIETPMADASGARSDSLRDAVRNYTLFRYMLGCNAKGDWPTKFNGGLFTFDPDGVDSKSAYTPDYRRWGGGTHTAQNQRLVYWPMLKSGDFDMMRPQFEFYRRLLPTAEARTRTYWGHDGACFTEQMENFGLPNPAEYGYKRPGGYDPGVEYNAWLEYEWDTALEFCQMILECERYAGMDITRYLPLIRSTLTFFDLHYTQRAAEQGIKSLDGAGHLILYPGSACETYKMTYNSASTVSALRAVLATCLQRPDTSAQWQGDADYYKALAQRIPPVPVRTVGDLTMIAPAEVWQRVNNVETPQLYPVFPWRLYGVGRADLDLARNTYRADPDALRFRSYKGWKQDAIWAACLGLTAEASTLSMQKLADGPYRFPAFWGPGFDWSPDHNWGGSGMIALQEMLLQEAGGKLYLFAAWPNDWDIHFKLHAPDQTTVEAALKGGRLVRLVVSPSTRMADVVLPAGITSL